MSVGKAELRHALENVSQLKDWEDARDLYPMITAQQRYKSVGFWDFLKMYQKYEKELKQLRDAASEIRGCDQRGYVPKQLDCPKRHWAKPFTAWDDGFNCSLCKLPVPRGTRCLGCRVCDHDVCADCVAGILHGAGDAQASSAPVTLPKRQLRKLFSAGQEKTCPKGHALLLATADDEYFCCDLCSGDVPKGARLRSCKTCSYDVCLRCLGETEPPPAPPPAEAAGKAKAKPRRRKPKATAAAPLVGQAAAELDSTGPAPLPPDHVALALPPPRAVDPASVPLPDSSESD